MNTPDRLRDATWALIVSGGPAALTSRAITDRAGANLAAITYHFGSKDTLVADVLVGRLQEWSAPLASALAAGDDAIAAAVADVLAQFASRGHEVVAVLRALMVDDALPGVGDAVSAWLREFRSVVVAVMAPQQAGGRIPSTVDLDAMAGLFTAVALGLIAQAAVDRSAPATDAVVAAFLGLLA